MEILLTKYHWLQLSHAQRTLMREVFNIPKSGGVEMQNGKVVSDGSNEHDLKAVNIESMQTFLESSDSSFEVLFNNTVSKIDAMIEQSKKDAEEALLKERAQERKESVEDIVGSMIETMENLPLDARIRIINHFKKTNNTEEVEVTNGEENSSSKKGKKGSNK